MSIILKDPVSGELVTIENPLLPEHIEVGRLFWYSGYTSTSSWDCPAVITRVNKRRKTFRVRSLDDMSEQAEEYDFAHTGEYADSRGSMRLVPSIQIKAYVAKQRAALATHVLEAKARLSSRKAALAIFDKVRATIPI
ncbi:MAG TPA: hypothetical protein VGE23_00635 [Candidatus Paceibacterota bacterium]